MDVVLPDSAGSWDRPQRVHTTEHLGGDALVAHKTREPYRRGHNSRRHTRLAAVFIGTY
ncbi:MAG: hypothetical protein LUD72_14765 [Bacteroidales bacterium]|nr:hypothetical protein [Bacteroidales bacterium]